MNENNNIEKNIKKPKKLAKNNNKTEDKKQKRKTYSNDELTEKEYNERKNKCYFFLRRAQSQEDYFNKIYKTINYRPLSNTKRKRRYREIIKLQNKFYNQIVQLEIPKKKKKKEEEKIIYDNLQPKTIWLNCKKIYNKYKKECIPIIKNLKKSNTYINNKKSFIKKEKTTQIPNISQSTFGGPTFPRKFERYRTKSHIFPKNLKKITFPRNSINQNDIKEKNSNYINYIQDKIDQNFENKGIGYIIKNRNLLKITGLPKYKSDEDIFPLKKNGNLTVKRNIPLFNSKKKSLAFNNPFSLGKANKIGDNQFYQYKLNYFFEIGSDKNDNKDEEEEENDLEIISKKGNIIIRELLFSKKENLEGYKEKQSVFNFFCLKKVFDLNDFNIFGVINGKGKESKKFSRLLKEILIEQFLNEKNYFNIINNIKKKSKNIKSKNDFIFNILTLEGNIFFKNIFNSLNDELKKKGVDIEETGATLFIVILIKDKIISIKIGDMYSYFFYSLSNDKNLNNNIITTNPHLEHLISNIIEQDRFEENKCEFILKKDEIGNNYYDIIYNDEEIQKLINEYKINFTRMVGFLKLKKIGIIGEPDIQILSMIIEPDNELKHSRRKSSSECSYYNKFKNGNNFDEGKLKYILMGNKELFEFLKTNYFFKEIQEGLIKDEENNKNKENIKYCFNLKSIVKKLVNDSVEIHKKYMKMETFRERCMALVTLT